MLAEMEYNEIGQLNKKTLHGNSSFDMNLYYQDAVGHLGGLAGENLYNGNISAITWKNDGESKQGYAFSYDGISRLKGADYGIGSSSLADKNTYDVSGIKYDENGNIKSLSRRENGSLIDALSYKYHDNEASNQLKGVEDTGSVRGFKDGTTATTQYLYDDNGNMRKDLNKGILSIEYNVLNLPEKIVFADGKEIKYVYSASGEKLQNIVNGKTLTYCGGFVYENGILQYILNSEGRYVVSGSSGAYEYNLTDHLGNVRAVVDGNGAIKQKSNYYPFGMTFDSYEGSTNKYLYNGKELQEETGWLDYGARMYSPELARWLVVDLAIEENHYDYTPYAYVYNNPVRLLTYMD